MPRTASSASRAPSTSLCRSNSRCARSDTKMRPAVCDTSARLVSSLDRGATNNHRSCLHSSGFQRVNLRKQARHVHNHAVSDDALRARVQDARGNEVQRVLFACGVINGVSRVCAALQTRRAEVRAVRDSAPILQAPRSRAQEPVKQASCNSGSRPCLAAGDDVIALRQNVDQLALALVAPLRAEN